MRPFWNGVGLAMAALAVVLFVVLFVPPAPSPGPEPIPPTSTVSCEEAEAICHLIDLLEDQRDDPTLTPAEREAIHDAAVEAGAIAADEPPTSTQPPATTTTTIHPSTTTTTTTIPRTPRDPGGVMDGILEDLGPFLPTTIPEVGEGDP